MLNVQTGLTAGCSSRTNERFLGIQVCFSGFGYQNHLIILIFKQSQLWIVLKILPLILLVMCSWTSCIAHCFTFLFSNSLYSLLQSLHHFCFIHITFVLHVTCAFIPGAFERRKLILCLLTRNYLCHPFLYLRQMPLRSFHKWKEGILNHCYLLTPQGLWNGCKSVQNGKSTVLDALGCLRHRHRAGKSDPEWSPTS